MTDSDLAAIEERAKARGLSRGPLRVERDEVPDSKLYPYDIVEPVSRESVAMCAYAADAALFAASRTDIPALIAEVRRLRGMVNK